MEAHREEPAIPRIPQRELRNDVSRILREVRDGATFDVTVDGHPVARISPVSARRTFVPTSEVLAMLRRLPPDPDFLDDLKAMRRESSADINPYGD